MAVAKKMLRILRTLSYCYILAIAAFWIWDSYAAGYLNWFIISIAAVIIGVALFQKRMLDIFFGIALFLLNNYMLLAVTSDLVHHLDRTKHVSRPWTYFGFGYGMFGLAAVAALLIVFAGYRLRQLGFASHASAPS
jgi:hypothetical protein